MFILRGIAVWFLIIAAESIHGTVRQILISPILGDLAARRLSFFVGLVIIFAIAYLSVDWIDARSTPQLLAVGLVWIILTAGFELGLGYLLGYSRERILEDYDLLNGGLMGLGLVAILIAPWLSAKLRRQASRG